jgi:hypothetical protein
MENGTSMTCCHIQLEKSLGLCAPNVWTGISKNIKISLSLLWDTLAFSINKKALIVLSNT